MALFAIGDLHMSTAFPKPMDKFGWINHMDSIIQDWKDRVHIEDVVLLAGDISWAMRLEEAKEDLKILNELPGTKVIIRGNHDYWWTSVKKMKALFPKLHFIHNNHVELKDYIIFGTRGWLCPNEQQFSDDDRKIYEREVRRLRNSIDSCSFQGDKKRILMLHYPPMNEQKEESDFTRIAREEKMDIVCYGHLHGRASHETAFIGRREGIDYRLVSCDYLHFKLEKLLD